MSENPYRPVQAGERIKGIPAGLYNSIIDLVKANAASGGGGVSGTAGIVRPTVRVKNDSGADVPAGGVLGIGGVAVLPSENQSVFVGDTPLSGVLPVASEHGGRFVVVPGGVNDGEIASGIVVGIAAVKLNISTDTLIRFADVSGGQSGYLVPSSSGVSVLWREAGTGTKWAVVRLGGGSDSSVLVKITGTASGGGKYLGRILTGAPTTEEADNLAMPEGMTVPDADNAVIVNLAENGASTHTLATNSFHLGNVVGSVDHSETPYALVVVGATPNQLFRVKVSQTGGSAGSSSAYCSFTYTVKTLGDVTLAMGAAPEASPARIVKMACTAATVGSAYFDDAGALKLFYVQEVGSSQENCT